MEGRSMNKGFFRFLLALCVMLTLLPAAALADAIEEYKASADVINDPKEDGTYSYVYFGMNGETPIKWRVLAPEDTNIPNATTYYEYGMFLLSEDFLGEPLSFRSYTDTPPDNANAYQASDLRTLLNRFGTTMFTEVEQSIIMASTKSDDGVSDILNGDRLFLLSAQEAGNPDYFPYGKDNLKMTTGGWWLRSPVSGNNVSTIASDGTMGQAAPNVSLYLRPAVNIRFPVNVFISDANGGKAGNGVSSTLAEVPASTPTEWKLTLRLPRDNSNNFYCDSGSRVGNKLTIGYNNAPTEGNEYISAIIQETNALSPRITHYGRILSPTSADGEATIMLPDDMENKKLLVFTEQYNGPYKTDYISSTLFPVDINPPTSAIEANPTSLSFGRAYEGGAWPAAQTVTLTNVGNQSVTIDLPTLAHYIVTAGDGFSDGRATLAGAGDTAAFTVQPNQGLGVGEYNGTIDVDVPDGVSASVPVSFTVKNPVAQIQPGTDGIVKGNRVYFGKYTENTTDYDVPWLVLDADDSSAFLLSEYLLGSSPFNTDYRYAYYQGSTLNAKMNALYNDENATLFTSLERGLIVQQANLNCAGGDGDDPNAPPVPEAYLYPLSTSEAAAQEWGSAVLQAKSITAQEGNAEDWWLRSSSSTDPRGVLDSGIMGIWENPDTSPAGVRPAFHLDSPQVLFASDAADGRGKSASGMEDNLRAVPAVVPTEWKLTLLDSDRNGFTARPTGLAYGTLGIDYSGAATGDNEYISAIIKDASGIITHYGRVRQTTNASDESGHVEFNVPGDMIGKTLYVFSEQYNGPYKTDYASDLIPVSTAIYAIKAKPASLSFGRLYVGGTPPAAQTVTLTNTGNRSVTINLPTSVTINELPTLDKYTIAAGPEFSNDNTATLAVGETATFTVQPNTALGVGEYSGTITIVENAVSGPYISKDLPTLHVSFKVKDPVAAILSGTGGFLSPYQYGGRSAYSHVYFGKDGTNPIAWRVLDASKTNTGADGVFLLSEEVLSGGTYQYIDYHDGHNIPYQSSILRQVLETNDNSILKTFFSGLEQGAMLATTTDNPSSLDSLDKDKLFPLSKDEAYSSAYFAVDRDTPRLASEDRVGKDGYGAPQEWWLRSPVSSSFVFAVMNEGSVSSPYRISSYYLRPAFNLIPSTVLFTSAEGGKAAAGMDGGLAAVGKNTADYWKLTLEDESRNGFAVHSTSIHNDVVYVRYIGATFGGNEYVSAIVKDSDGKIAYYGRVGLAENKDDGVARIDLTGIDMTGKTLYVFNEQYNGEQKTDYASPLREVAIPEVIYSIEASPATLDFYSLYEGYVLPEYQILRIDNTGNQDMTVHPSALTNYTIREDRDSDDDPVVFEPYHETDFYIQPKASLGAGVYNETLTISGLNGASATVELRFAVKAPVPVIQPGAGGIARGNTVYFGQYTDTGAAIAASYPVPWTALQPDGFLLSKYVLGQTVFRPTGDAGYYGENAAGAAGTGSALKAAIDGLYNGTNALFSTVEQGAVVETTLEPDSMFAGTSAVRARLYPLSPEEVRGMCWDYEINLRDIPSITNPSGVEIRYWSRTSSNSSQAYITGRATYGERTYQYAGIRPAFHLNASPVLFASAAVDGKSVAGMDGGLTPVPVGVPTEWKLTLEDENRRGFAAEVTERNGDVLTLSYTGAKTGENEYLSAAIVDGAGNVLHYGRVLRLDGTTNGASGTAEIRLPASAARGVGGTLQVFNEQYNDDQKTDYAGKPISINVQTVTAVTVSPASASVVKGATQGFSATVAGAFNPPLTVAWSVAGNSSADTTISADGVLTVALGETAASLTVTATSTYDASKFGTAAVTLTNPPPTVITRQPTEQRVTEGQRATFSLAAEGDGLTYQWSVDHGDGTGWHELSGATSASYTTSVTVLAYDGFRYRCTIVDINGAALDSDIVALRVVKADVPPKTGDSATPLLWLGLLLLGGAGALRLRKRRGA